MDIMDVNREIIWSRMPNGNEIVFWTQAGNDNRKRFDLKLSFRPR